MAKLSQRITRTFRQISALTVAIHLITFSTLPAYAQDIMPETLASPSSSASSVGPQGPIGPQGPTGPQGPIGPQGNIGPSEEKKGASASPSPAPATAQAATGTGDGTTASNDNTGQNSDNTATNNQDNTTNIDQQNTANLDNTITVGANSGDNSAGGNTGDGTVRSGDINGQITVVNVSNSQATNGSTINAQSLSGNQTRTLAVGTGTGTALSAYNSQTGNNSINNATANRNNRVEVNILNEATTNNTVAVVANTGNNHADANTGRGRVESGNVNLAVNLINLLNTFDPTIPVDMHVLSVFGDVLTDLLFPTTVANSNTGNNSSNSATANVNNDLNVALANDAEINNTVGYNLNTGNNTADGNTLGGSTQSGKVNANTSISNVANTPAPTLWLINVDGECDCDLSSLDPSKYILNVLSGPNATGNSNTGNNSQNTATTNENNETNVNITNNGSVNNNLSITANTGNNSANGNTGGGSVKSGDINVMSNIVNVVNSSAKAGEKFVLGVINIFGNWRGKALTQKPVTPTPPPTVTTASNISGTDDNQVTAAASTDSNDEPESNQRTSLFNSLPKISVTQPSIKSQPTTKTTNNQTTRRQLFAQSTPEENTQNKASVDLIVDPAEEGDDAQVRGTTTTSSDDGDGDGRGRNGWWASVAHAATQSGVLGTDRSYLGMLAIPAALWIISEFIFGRLERRRRQTVES